MDPEQFRLPDAQDRGELVFWAETGDHPSCEERASLANHPQEEQKPLSLRSESAACN